MRLSLWRRSWNRSFIRSYVSKKTTVGLTSLGGGWWCGLLQDAYDFPPEEEDPEKIKHSQSKFGHTCKQTIGNRF